MPPADDWHSERREQAQQHLEQEQLHQQSRRERHDDLAAEGRRLLQQFAESLGYPDWPTAQRVGGARYSQAAGWAADRARR